MLGSGNLGLIYLMEERHRLTREELDTRHPELLPALRAHPHVGWLLVHSSEHGAVALGARGTHYLVDGRVEGEDPLAAFSPTAPQHLMRTDGFAHVADIMVGSFYDPELDEGCAFEELICFHGGIGGVQTRPFILHPAHLPVPPEPDHRRRQRARHPRRLAQDAPVRPAGAGRASARRVRGRRRVKRQRVMRTLTFWLRPDFVLRVVSRFQKVAGFDRAIALASGALTATIPLMIVISSVSTHLGGKDTAERIIDRYELTGGGAKAVEDVFAPPSGTSTSLGLIGFLFLMVAVLSFTRAVQRLFEQGWELPPMSVRNTFNGLLWIGGLTLYMGLSGFLHAALGRSRLELAAALLAAPLTVIFLTWSGRKLSAERLSRQDVLPFAVIGAALLAVYSVAATVYVPGLFNTYATRYGVIGAVFAMISALFSVMVVLVVSAAAGREVRDELGRIHRGEKPADDEVRRQWQEVTAQARSRWETLRLELEERRRKREKA